MCVDTRHSCVVDETAFEALHDIERGPNHGVIVAEDVCFRDGHICLLQCVDYLVFAVDSMRSLRQELARGFLSEDIFRFGRIGELVGRIALAEAELEER